MDGRRGIGRRAGEGQLLAGRDLGQEEGLVRLGPRIGRRRTLAGLVEQAQELVLGPVAHPDRLGFGALLELALLAFCVNGQWCSFRR